MSEHKHTNQLIHETSPYLLQHAHNPVNWFAWNDDALQKSKAEDKPILVSIGYSACHWCHVMERESFEDEATAQIMNEHFINIKIDREERPDIDHIYMDAVQAISGSGGWPLNVFLTPDLKPFFGGTYFPPVNMYNRSSWRDVLLTVINAYKEKKDDIHAQADALMEHLQHTNLINTNITAVENESLNIIATNLLKIADNEWGGFGQAPKFPQTFSILYLLRHSFFTNDENALNTAVLSLGKMMMGGIYDHLGGGFCRYSTDRRWQIPHFEKMLYDNALLIEVYTEAFQLTKNNDYALVVDETIKFIQRELTSSQGGFYSALDADSEGVEGKYYTWSKKEIDDLLREKSKTFCTVYNVLEEGNWEHTNILWMPDDVDTASEKFDFDKEEFLNDLPFLKATLFKARQIRIRPNLDDKVLLSWNALAITALCKAYAVFDNELYLQMAETNIIFIEKYLFNSSNELLHSWNKITNQQPAFLDDYATLIRAYISLHEVSANTDYLLKAKALTQKTIELFSDEEELFFYFTSKTQKDVLLRKTDYYDGATPSGNSLMATNLILLSVFFDISDWNLRAEKMIMRIKHLSEKYPTSFGIWNLNLQLLIYKLKEIVVTGNDFNKLIKQILQEYIPLKIIQSSYKVDDDWPLLKGKQVNLDNNKIYICENYNCREPATNFESFQKLLNQHF